jgi:hypothetical protein
MGRAKSVGQLFAAVVCLCRNETSIPNVRQFRMFVLFSLERSMTAGFFRFSNAEAALQRIVRRFEEIAGFCKNWKMLTVAPRARRWRF